MKIIPQIEFKSVLEDITDINKRNKRFKSLSEEGQRLETAWEALKLVVNNIADPSTHAEEYRYWNRELLNIVIYSHTSEELQKNLLKVKKCTVCARGIMTLAKIRIGNNVDPVFNTETDIARGCNDSTRGGFSFFDFKKMEIEYEFNEYGHPYCHNTKEKLANILCNVLVNGNFNIDDKTDYLTSKK